jgi:TPR repeat protein
MLSIRVIAAASLLLSASVFGADPESIVCGNRFSEKAAISEENREVSQPGLAEFNEGLEHQLGTNGRQKNPQLALERYQRSAELGSRAGMFGYAAMRERLAESDADVAVAFSWYKKLADLDDPGGLAMLSLAYKHGLAGYKKNMTEYRRLVMRAAELGSISAQLVVLADLERLTKPTKAEADAMFCLNWRLAAGNGRHEEALAKAYCVGKGVKKNQKRADYWQCRAKSVGETAAQDCANSRTKWCVG